VTLLRSDYYFNIKDHKEFWGYIPSEGSKIGNNEIKELGLPCKINDKIALLLHFSKTGMELKLFINSIELCTLFTLPLGHLYYPCAVLKFDGMKVKVSNRVPLPDGE
jgi:hypothetical protein